MSSAAIAQPLPDDVEAVLEGLEAFVKAEVIVRHDQHADLLDDARRRFGPDGAYAPEVVELIRAIRMASARAGYFNLAVPTSLGGGGMGFLAYYAAWEHIYHLCGGTRWLAQFAISHWAFGPSAILERVTERARDEVLAGMMAGELMMCFGMSEPDAGSDATMIRTRAEPDGGGGWRLHGRKIWTTHVPIADWMIVLAITNPERAAARRGGISAFLMPTSAEGFRIDRIIGMWGEPGGPEAESVLDGVRVEPWQLVGDLDEGFQIGLQGVSLGRVYNSARSVGLARWALELAVATARSAGPSVSPSPTTRASRSHWPRRPPRSMPPTCWASTPPGCSTGGTGRSRSCRWPRPTRCRPGPGPSTGPCRPSGPWASPTSWAWPRRTTRCG